ncbi:MAG TPA: hypothetical protein VFH39_03365 [Candidatus Saccharimonadales bacterium]|nr:hypothetical protein [Candidatus Saccharimonadales bacterium]
MAEKNRRQPKGKAQSRARATAHKYDMKKMATVVNHVDYERRHGYESAHHREKKAGRRPESPDQQPPQAA